MSDRAAISANSIVNRGALLNNCGGVIDCTRIEMARSSGRDLIQILTYSGQKSIHVLIYQTETTTKVLMMYMYGPEVGRRHDLTLCKDRGIDAVRQELLFIDCKQFCLFGYPACKLRP